MSRTLFILLSLCLVCVFCIPDDSSSEEECRNCRHGGSFRGRHRHHHVRDRGDSHEEEDEDDHPHHHRHHDRRDRSRSRHHERLHDSSEVYEGEDEEPIVELRSNGTIQLPSGALYEMKTPNFTKAANCETQFVELDRGDSSNEFQLIADEMTKTRVDLPNCATRGGCFKSYKITKIEKLFNRCLWNKYQERLQKVAQQDKKINEVLLFHGTCAARAIAQIGFDERYSSLNTKYGAGIHFVRASSGANEYAVGSRDGCPKSDTSERSILLARVSLGGEYRVTGDEAKAFTYAPIGHHCVVGRQDNNPYDDYVVYRGEDTYPLYIITYSIVP